MRLEALERGVAKRDDRDRVARLGPLGCVELGDQGAGRFVEELLQLGNGRVVRSCRVDRDVIDRAHSQDGRPVAVQDVSARARGPGGDQLRLGAQPIGPHRGSALGNDSPDPVAVALQLDRHRVGPSGVPAHGPGNRQLAAGVVTSTGE